MPHIYLALKEMQVLTGKLNMNSLNHRVIKIHLSSIAAFYDFRPSCI